MYTRSAGGEAEAERVREEVCKGTRGMPRLSEAMKDATSCENPREGANGRRSAGVRMGQPGTRKGYHSDLSEGKPGELKHLSTRRRRKQQ